MWDVVVKKVTDVTSIPEADAIETIWLGGWPLVAPKNKHKIGDLVIYIPIDSVLPDKLIEEMGLVGRLAGSRKNRVKAVKLRKQLSIGLILPAPGTATEGESFAGRLGIIQYEEVIPPEYAGFAIPKPRGWLKYDVENINNATAWLIEGEEIAITEKEHGCFHADSPVLMADNTYKNIDRILPGDLVKSYDLKSLKFVDKPVKRVINSGKSDLIAWIKLTTSENKEIICTSNHLFLTNIGWIQAKDLTPSHKLLSPEN